jgi:uncharacterized protein (DUF305 family)
MRRTRILAGARARALPLLLCTPLLTACATAPATNEPPLLGATTAPPLRQPYTPADVHFMAGMIPHHAQAVRMTALVPSRSSREDVKAMAERMRVSQVDEIALIQDWLRDRDETVPAADATHHHMDHGGVHHAMLMPGMLTEEEFALLEGAHGVAFDRLFLTLMIRHHEGALAMVNDLFAAPGAAQDDFVYKFASDVNADQHMEIRRMQQILETLPGGTP